MSLDALSCICLWGVSSLVVSFLIGKALGNASRQYEIAEAQAEAKKEESLDQG